MGKPSSPNKLLGMERLTKITDHKSPKQVKKAKREPMRVVYIPNPVRFESSAADFRELVQKHTGWDSDVADTPEFHVVDRVDAPVNHEPVSADADRGAEFYEIAETPFDMWGEVFTPRMMQENFPAIMRPSGFYEPPIGAFWSFDEV